MKVAPEGVTMNQNAKPSTGNMKAQPFTKVELHSETLTEFELLMLFADKSNLEKAETDANTVWPWIGFAANATQNKAIPKHKRMDVLGVLDYDKLNSWLSMNLESVTPVFLHLLCRLAHKSGRKHIKAKAASLKNEPIREWVMNAWKNREDKGQSKAAFSREYVKLVKHKFGQLVTAETIARAWLPKTKT